MADKKVKHQIRRIAAGSETTLPPRTRKNGQGGMTSRNSLTALPEASSDTAVYDAIYEAVMDHRLAPGTRLTEASLCDIFGVSRAVVRMALLRLSHDRIVALTPNR